jgi:hypothetical protein
LALLPSLTQIWIQITILTIFRLRVRQRIRTFAVPNPQQWPKQDEHKFELCDVIRTILRSFPKSNFDEESWLPMLQRGLHDILFSKISKRQRDPAMQLVAAVIEVSGRTGRSGVVGSVVYTCCTFVIMSFDAQ